MQTCYKCGASWNTERILDVCPFCNVDLNEKKKITSIEDAFAVIVERHGKVPFKGSAILGMLGDYAPGLTQERRLVRIAVEAGAYNAIYEAADNEKSAVLERYVVVLSENYFIDKSWARKVLMWCLCALVPEKCTQVPSVEEEQIIEKKPANPVVDKQSNNKQVQNGTVLSTTNQGTKKPPKQQRASSIPKWDDSTNRSNKPSANILMRPVGKTSALFKKNLRLTKGFSDIRDIPRSQCSHSIELPDAKFDRHYFDLQATADLYDTEYYLVTQPMEGQSGDVLFVFKNPDGTANPPILIPSGKQVNKLIKEFQKIFEKKYNFV